MSKEFSAPEPDITEVIAYISAIGGEQVSMSFEDWDEVVDVAAEWLEDYEPEDVYNLKVSEKSDVSMVFSSEFINFLTQIDLPYNA